jgi:myosin heavy subunit
MVAFTNHCAIFLQKHIRRHLTQKEYQRMLAKKRKVAALVRGWKCRRLIELSQLGQLIRSSSTRGQDRKLYVE